MFVSPVYSIKKVHIDNIVANDYNPNKVASREMQLLYLSIKEDGYTMPIVCYFDKNINKYIIVDGYHRYTIMLLHKDIRDREDSMLPVSLIDKDINNRIASTIRHNRARGKHSVELQSNIVSMLKEGWNEIDIIKKLGMTAEELQRLLGILSISSEVANLDYSIETQILDAGRDDEDI